MPHFNLVERKCPRSGPRVVLLQDFEQKPDDLKFADIGEHREWYCARLAVDGRLSSLNIYPDQGHGWRHIP